MTKKIFNYGIKRGLVQNNPAAAFEVADAGGNEEARTRWLTRAELVLLLEAMRKARGWAYQNTILVKLLLMLCVRKNELITARVKEFDLDAGVWYLPSERTKTGSSIDIPLARQAVELLRDLVRLAEGSEWLLPARKMGTRMMPHISPDTLNAALAKNVRPLLPVIEPFVVHDFRRTGRTHLQALGFAPHVCERCLNHKIKGVVGIYDRHDYFDERKTALQAWADLLDTCEQTATTKDEKSPNH